VLGEARNDTDLPDAAASAYRCALDLAQAQPEHPDAAIWIEEATGALAGQTADCETS